MNSRFVILNLEFPSLFSIGLGKVLPALNRKRESRLIPSLEIRLAPNPKSQIQNPKFP